MSRQGLLLLLLLTGIVIVSVTGISQRKKYKKLVEKNSTLVLQNDSILSVNLQCEKELSGMKSRLDSIQNNLPAEKQ